MAETRRQRGVALAIVAVAAHKNSSSSRKEASLSLREDVGCVERKSPRRGDWAENLFLQNLL